MPQKRRKGINERADFGMIGEFAVQVLDVTQQMCITVLHAAGNLVVPAIPINHQNTRQAFRTQHIMRHLSRARLPETKQRETWRGEQPCVSVATVVAPTGFVRMFDGGLPILGQQGGNGWLQTTRQPVQRMNQTAETDARFAFQPSQRDAMQIMLHRDMCQQAVAEQTFG